MIVLHHLEQSRSQRIAWLLEELRQPYEIKRYARDPETMLAPPELRAVHRLGKAPVIVEDGFVVFESGAIIEYLLERHGGGTGLRPAPGTPEHVAYITFLHFAEGSLMPPLLLRLIFATMARKAPILMRPVVTLVTKPARSLFVDPTIERTLDFLEDELGKRPWFAGPDFTGADIQMSFPLEAVARRGDLSASRPRLMDWLDRIHARPANQIAMRKIGEKD